MILLCLYDINNVMNKLKEYIENIVGLKISIDLLPQVKIELLPLYLKEGYDWGLMKLDNRSFILFTPKDKSQFNTSQLEKHQKLILEKIGLPAILLLDQIDAYGRKRLIEKKIAFVVPNKQIFIPQFLLDLRETGLSNKKTETNQLSATAQLVVLIYLLDKNKAEAIEKQSFKKIAKNLSVKPMEITRAVANLKELGLIETVGDKNKNKTPITPNKGDLNCLFKIK